MPIYTWKDKKSGKEVSVIRAVKDIDQPPTPEEVCDLKLQDAEWQRITCAPAIKRSINWPGKGNW